MNHAIHLAIMLAVAAHMVFGCCWHHAHAVDCAKDLSVGVKSTECACDHDAHRRENGACDHDHDKEHGCGEHACVFTRSDAPDGSDLFAALQDCVPVSQLPAIAAPRRSTTCVCMASGVAPSVPLHLLNQVLLI